MVLRILLLGLKATGFGVLGRGLIPLAPLEGGISSSKCGLVFLFEFLSLLLLLGFLGRFGLLRRYERQLVLRILLVGFEAARLGVLGGGLVPAFRLEGRIGCGDGRLVFLLELLRFLLLFGLLLQIGEDGIDLLQLLLRIGFGILQVDGGIVLGLCAGVVLLSQQSIGLLDQGGILFSSFLFGFLSVQPHLGVAQLRGGHGITRLGDQGFIERLHRLLEVGVGHCRSSFLDQLGVTRFRIPFALALLVVFLHETRLSIAHLVGVIDVPGEGSSGVVGFAEGLVQDGIVDARQIREHGEVDVHAMPALALLLRYVAGIDGDVLPHETRLGHHDLVVGPVIQVHLVLAAGVRGYIDQLGAVLEHRDGNPIELLRAGEVLHRAIDHHVVHLRADGGDQEHGEEHPAPACRTCWLGSHLVTNVLQEVHQRAKLRHLWALVGRCRP